MTTAVAISAFWHCNKVFIEELLGSWTWRDDLAVSADIARAIGMPARRCKVRRAMSRV
jgi:hypothetical protein